VIQGVGRDDDVRGAVPGENIGGGLRTEIARDDVQPFLSRELGDVGGGIDPQGANPHVVSGAEEEAVVAADVDEQRIGAGQKTVADAAGEIGEVAVHRVGSRRDVEIVIEKSDGNLVADLNEAAAETDMSIEVEGRLGLRELIGAEERIRGGMRAERQVSEKVGALAGSADHAPRSSRKVRYQAM